MRAGPGTRSRRGTIASTRSSGISSRYVGVLTQLGVPCFYPTRETEAVETQRRLLRELHAACAAAPGAGRPPRRSGGP